MFAIAVDLHSGGIVPNATHTSSIISISLHFAKKLLSPCTTTFNFETLHPGLLTYSGKFSLQNFAELYPDPSERIFTVFIIVEWTHEASWLPCPTSEPGTTLRNDEVKKQTGAVTARCLCKTHHIYESIWTAAMVHRKEGVSAADLYPHPLVNFSPQLWDKIWGQG